MKCVVYSSSDVKIKDVDEEIKLENDVIMVGIKTLGCGNCGEIYYYRHTVKMLEDIKEKLRNRDLELDVIVMRIPDVFNNLSTT
jgi:hypothetical protein